MWDIVVYYLLRVESSEGDTDLQYPVALSAVTVCLTSPADTAHIHGGGGGGDTAHTHTHMYT